MSARKLHEEESAPASQFPRKSVLIEKPRRNIPKAEKLRMMLLRDENDKLLRLMGRSLAGQEALADLLFDRMAGIGPLAADLFRLAASKGMDIGAAVPRLTEALSDKYLKANASAALAIHYLNIQDHETFNTLLFSEDRDIAKAAQMVAMKEALDAKKG